MSWRFRKSFKVLPGVKLNLTARGLSATIGAAPFSVNVGPRGVYRNISIPGTGVWDRQRVDSPSQSVSDERIPQPSGQDVAPQPTPLTLPAVAYGSVAEIRSASTEMLKSKSMADLQKLLEETYEERSGLDREIRSGRREADLASGRYLGWKNGFLLKRIFPKSFAARKEIFETAQAKLDELREQQQLTVLATQIEIDQQQAEPYYKMRDSFAAMCEAQKIWDTLERRTIDRGSERSVATESVTRDSVTFALDSCDLIQWDQKVLHMPNRTGGDLYIYPGFALYRAAIKAFALIETREIRLSCASERFIEQNSVPSDAQVIGQTWAKSNKDGSPDRRFRDNFQIPIVRYGSLRFTSQGGLNEEFLISNAALAERFANSWNSYQASFEPSDQTAGSGKLRDSTSMCAGKPVIPSAVGRTGDGEHDIAPLFAKESAKARALALENDEYWQPLLAEELLRSKLASLESECGEIDNKLESAPRRQFRGGDFIRWLSARIGEVTPMCEKLASVVNEGQKTFWRRPGEPINAIQILGSVDAILDCCRSFLTWETDICAAVPPAKLKRLGTAFRGITMSIVGDLRGLPDALALAVESARHGSNEPQMNLNLSFPPQVAKCMAEMDEVTKHPEWARG